MPNQPLLSIVIPTRNRAETAIYAIKSALSVSMSDNVEVIVHDCSDGNELETQIPSIKDPRLKYFKVAPCDMTANWNLAFGYVKGKYVTYIGDDDCVLKIIMRVAEQCDLLGIDSVWSTRPATYFWPKWDGKTLNGYLIVYPYTNKEEPFSIKNSTEELLLRKHSLSGEFPNAYQGLVKVSLLRKIQQIAGVCFLTHCPDAFLSVLLCMYSKNCWKVDYPFVLNGVSQASNSGRSTIKGKASMEHYNEYKDAQPDFIPTGLLLMEGIRAEIIFECLKLLNMEWFFFKNYPLIKMYAAALVARKQNIRNRIDVIRKYFHFVSGSSIKFPYFLLACLSMFVMNIQRKVSIKKKNSMARHYDNIAHISQAAGFLQDSVDSTEVRLI
jgi:glycosyltransferase involved in cell wall biosynthesis